LNEQRRGFEPNIVSEEREELRSIARRRALAIS